MAEMSKLNLEALYPRSEKRAEGMRQRRIAADRHAAILRERFQDVTKVEEFLEIPETPDLERVERYLEGE